MFLSVITVLCLLQNGCRQRDLRATGFSEPLTKSQVINLSVESESMGRTMPCLIYLPKGYGSGEEYPVWYGLNSYSTDETMWIDNGVAEVADDLIEKGELRPLIMVFPYTKDATFKEITQDFEDDGKFGERNIDKFISGELVPYIDKHYYTQPTSDSRSIGGFSMGGMIALRIAFHHTDLFRKVGGYSASVPDSDYSDHQLEKWLYPNDTFEENTDITSFDREKGFDKLIVYLDAGNSNDPFSVGLQSLNDALQNRGISSDFQIYDGGHTLRVSCIGEYLKFYAGTD
jgi:enterochelin esterase-like enzyme